MENFIVAMCIPEARIAKTISYMNESSVTDADCKMKDNFLHL